MTEMHPDLARALRIVQERERRREELLDPDVAFAECVELFEAMGLPHAQALHAAQGRDDRRNAVTLEEAFERGRAKLDDDPAVEDFRRIGLSEAEARHAARGRDHR